VRRALEEDPERGHGFVRAQRMGMEVFKDIPPEAPLVVAAADWQYSHHVLAGLRTHRGPILTVARVARDWPGRVVQPNRAGGPTPGRGPSLTRANWAPEWPGLVGRLTPNGRPTKRNREYSTRWTVDGTDAWFRDGIASWIESGRIEHDASHVRPLPELPGTAEVELGRALADQLRQDKAIIGIFDEGCMGMYNAIIDDEMLNPLGIYKERLSQSALWAEMQTVPDEEADAVGTWLREAGMTFRLG